MLLSSLFFSPQLHQLGPFVSVHLEGRKIYIRDMLHIFWGEATPGGCAIHLLNRSWKYFLSLRVLQVSSWSKSRSTTTVKDRYCVSSRDSCCTFCSQYNTCYTIISKISRRSWFGRRCAFKINNDLLSFTHSFFYSLLYRAMYICKDDLHPQ